MPYINQAARLAMDVQKAPPIDLGELNYTITQLIIGYIRDHGLKYHTLAEVTGVLENVKQELYRRVASPYEDTKRAENGDVYPWEMTILGRVYQDEVYKTAYSPLEFDSEGPVDPIAYSQNPKVK